MVSRITVALFVCNANAHDTTFFYKDTIDNEFIQSIYLEDSNSTHYSEITNFDFGEWESDAYKLSLDYFSGSKIKLTKATPVITWKTWVALKQYKGAFYVYRPCDFLFHYQESINDSTFIDWTGEGPVANKIIKQHKVDSVTFVFQLTGIYDQNRTVTVHIIDASRGIAVFEEKIEGRPNQNILMIAADKVRSVPIIVNHCPEVKQREMHFEKPDFEALLPKR